MQSEPDERMTSSKSNSQLSLKLSKFCGGSHALKCINERCIATLHNVAKDHSSITLNKS